MQDLVTAVTTIGILPVIILILLWDYSKKLAVLQLEMAKCNQTNTDVKDHLAKVIEKLDKIEDKL